MPDTFRFNAVQYLPVAELHMEPEYQRSTSQTRAQKIAASFDPNLFDPVMVTIRDDMWWVVDGGHRVAAAKILGIPEIPVVLVESDSVMRDAQLYTLKNSGQRTLKAVEMHKAQVVAGEPESVMLDREIRMTGWVLGSDLRCIGALSQGQRTHGIMAVSRALRAVRAATEKGDRASARVVAGLITLVGTYPELDDLRLEKVLIKHINKIDRTIRELGDNGGGTRGKYGMQVLIKFYNGQMQHGRLGEDES